MSVLTFLGKDSGFGEKNNSAYYEENNKIYFIDCGFTVLNDIKNKFDLNKYEEINVIITHLHNDHAGSLSQLILYVYFLFNKRINIISACSRIEEYLDITGTPKSAYEIKRKTENIKMIETDHSDYIEAYGFEAKLNGKKILYTGDTRKFESFIPYLEDIDEFYVDVSKFGGAHLRIDDILDELRKIKSNGTDIYLMHVDDKEYVKEITKGEFYL